MEVYAILYEDGSMDEGPIILEDEVYSSIDVAQARMIELFNRAVKKKQDPNYYHDGYLKNKFEKELREHVYGNLVPLYQVTTLIIKEKPSDVE